MADPIQPDLCVVGAGALGIALAQYANALGARVTLVDRGVAEPGDGPQGKLRLAALQASTARAHAIRSAGALGLGSAELKISTKLVQERAKAVAASVSAMTGFERLSALGIEVIGGSVSFVDQSSLMIGDIQIKPRRIVLALGGRPNIPAIPGLDQIDYFTPDSILDNNRKLTHLLVIGGNAEAFALAQAFARLGSEVTLVPQGGLLPDHDPEAVAFLLESLRSEGVRIIDDGALSEIIPRPQGIGAIVDLQSSEVEALDVSHVLVATDRLPDLETLLPEKARLARPDGSTRQYARGPLGETSNRRIRVVGAGAGIEQWNYALAHGRVVIENLFLGAPLEKLAPQPHLVLTEPALAQIGGVVKRAKAAQSGQRLLRVNMVENEQARALAVPQGVAKVHLASDGSVIGAGLVGPGAAEMGAVLALLMEKGIPLHDLARLSLPDPNLLSSLVALGEQAAALRSISPLAMRWRAAKRALSFWRR